LITLTDSADQHYASFEKKPLPLYISSQTIELGSTRVICGMAFTSLHLDVMWLGTHGSYAVHWRMYVDPWPSISFNRVIHTSFLSPQALRILSAVVWEAEAFCRGEIAGVLLVCVDTWRDYRDGVMRGGLLEYHAMSFYAHERGT